MTPTIAALHVADDAAAWERVGFFVRGETCRLGEVELRFQPCASGRGLVGWTLRGATSTDLDGLATTLEEPGGAGGADAPAHPNGALALDHVVVFSPGFDRTVVVLEAAGLVARRFAEIGVKYPPVRRAFYRLGGVVLELVEQSGDGVDPSGPAFFWGIAVTVTDVDGLGAHLGDRSSGVRDAVQPGRRILPLRRAAGLSLPVAFMSPGLPRPARSRGAAAASQGT